MDRPRQFSEGTRLDGILSVLKVSDRTLGNAGLAREELGRKLLGSLSNFFQVFRIHYSLVFPKRPFHWIQRSSFRHQGRGGPPPPPGRPFSANETNLPRHNVPAHK